MQFKVPQFLDIEDKIFGPFTFRQFIYLVGGAGLCFVIYRLLGFWFGVIPIIIFAALSLALAFYKPNNKPFIFMIEAMFNYFTQDKLYIWKNPKTKASAKSPEMAIPLKADRDGGEAKLTGNKLRDLAWSLDVLDLNKGNGSSQNTSENQNK